MLFYILRAVKVVSVCVFSTAIQNACSQLWEELIHPSFGFLLHFDNRKVQSRLFLLQSLWKLFTLLLKLFCSVGKLLLVKLCHIAYKSKLCGCFVAHLRKHCKNTLWTYNVLLHDYITLQRQLELEKLSFVKLSCTLVQRSFSAKLSAKLVCTAYAVYDSVRHYPLRYVSHTL